MGEPKDLTPLVGMYVIAGGSFGVVTATRNAIIRHRDNELEVSSDRWVNVQLAEVSRDGANWVRAVDFLAREARDG